jgi:cellulose synthase/poly-beta-1,6-N-acetylglucosamine synthase-like glycosyltransferase
MASSKPSAEALPAVSVIVPVHNVAPWIGETLASVLNQTGFDDFEVLVVDDRSTDETPAAPPAPAIVGCDMRAANGWRS